MLCFSLTTVHLNETEWEDVPVSDSVYSSGSLVQPFSTSAFLFTPFSSNPFALTFRSTAGTPWMTLGNSEGQGSSFSLLAVWSCGREALDVGDKPMMGAPNGGLSWLSCPCLSHSSWRLWRWRGLLSRRPVNSIHTFRFFTSCSEGCGHTSAERDRSNPCIPCINIQLGWSDLKWSAGMICWVHLDLLYISNQKGRFWFCDRCWEGYFGNVMGKILQVTLIKILGVM